MNDTRDATTAVDAGRLRAAVAAIFQAAGCDEAEGARIARYLVEPTSPGTTATASSVCRAMSTGSTRAPSTPAAA